MLQPEVGLSETSPLQNQHQPCMLLPPHTPNSMFRKWREIKRKIIFLFKNTHTSDLNMTSQNSVRALKL